MPFHTEYCNQFDIFREKYLLKNIIDHKFCINKKIFEQIYNQEQAKTQKKIFTKEGASNLAWKLDLGMGESLITYCWGMSKLTVVDEENSNSMYKKMSFIEFLEFIARMFFLKAKFRRDNIDETEQADYLLMK